MFTNKYNSYTDTILNKETAIELMKFLQNNIKMDGEVGVRFVKWPQNVRYCRTGSDTNFITKSRFYDAITFEEQNPNCVFIEFVEDRENELG